MSLVAYGFPNTRSVRMVWCLEECGLDYEYKLVNLKTGGSQSPEFLELNPSGKVPVMIAEGVTILESAAIVNYIATLAPDKELIPQGNPLRRATYDQWTNFAVTELEQPLWTMGKHKFALPAEQRCPDVLSTAKWEFQKALRLFSEGLGDEPYILGDQFSAADILLAHTLFWGMAFKQDITQDNLKAYIGRMGVRPALGKARELEQSALASAE